MDDEAIPYKTTTTASTGQALKRMNTVVVFGDSLSDIGKKWTTKSGRAARLGNEMYVSPTGRFSDCRNWTDFMYEAATGSTLIVKSASDSIAKSSSHYSLTSKSFNNLENQSFMYANYAEGGACGDTPASKGPFLGTFKDQVDAFEKDCKSLTTALGNTLFIIWFGANDIYTAGRQAAEMAQVAEQIARTQRGRLNLIVRSHNETALGPTKAVNYGCKFIFCDLCRPLTSVRYSLRLKNAEDKVKALLGKEYVAATRRLGDVSTALHTYQQAFNSPQQYRPGKNWRGIANEMELLRAQVEATKELENGVLVFNATLAAIAHQNGDRVVEVSWCVSEDTVRKLVTGNYRLIAGAMSTAVKTHIPAMSYGESTTSQHITTIDEVHPSDEMYRLLWLQIYEQIKRSGCTFGKLSPVMAATPDALLADLAGPAQPSAQTRQAYDAVMKELLS
jgi:lysophospholipase L1-like esterase